MLQRHIKHIQAVDVCNLHRQWWSGMWFSTIHQTSSPRKYNWLQLASVSQITNCLYRQPSKQRHNKKQRVVPVRRKSAKWGKISPWAMAVSPPSGLNSSNKELVSLRSALFWAAKAAAKSTLIQQMKENHGPPSAAQEAVVQALQAVQATGHHLGSQQMAELVGQTVTSISLKQGGLVGRYGSLPSESDMTWPSHGHPFANSVCFFGDMSRVINIHITSFVYYMPYRYSDLSTLSTPRLPSHIRGTN